MWLAEAVPAHAPAAWNAAVDCDKNGLGVRDLDAATRARPLIGVVRNPWDWYVSWFYHHPEDPRTMDYARSIGGFRQALPRMLGLVEVPDRCQWRTLSEADDTLLPNLTVIKHENLIGDLVAAIEALGVTVPASFTTSLQAHPRVNAGLGRRARHDPVGDPELPDPYADHYTQTEIDLVAAADAALIAQFGYTFS